jgi:hypothetical protein
MMSCLHKCLYLGIRICVCICNVDIDILSSHSNRYFLRCNRFKALADSRDGSGGEGGPVQEGSHGSMKSKGKNKNVPTSPIKNIIKADNDENLNKILDADTDKPQQPVVELPPMHYGIIETKASLNLTDKPTDISAQLDELTKMSTLNKKSNMTMEDFEKVKINMAQKQIERGILTFLCTNI